MRVASKKAGLCLALLLAASVLIIPSALCQSLPTFTNVIIVVGENKDFSSAYNSTNMPYLTPSPTRRASE